MSTKPLEEETEVVKEEEGNTIPVADEGDSNVFADLTDEMDADDRIVDYGVDEEEGETEVEGTEEEAPGDGEVLDDEEPAPLAAEAEEPTAEETPATEEAPTPEVEAAAEATPEVQEQESEPTPEVKGEEPEPAKSYDALRTEALEELETKTFALSEEDAQTLVTEPEKILPKLAATVYMEAYENISKAVMAALPNMIGQTMSYQSAVDKATDSFYTKWDKLDRHNAKHSETVARIGSVYRQVNPKATAEQYIAEVGAQALLALGIPFEEIVDAPATEVQKPFQPASPSGAAPKPAVKKPTGPWESLAEELLTDDEM